MSFNDQLKSLIFYHLQEYTSGSELLQALEQNDFAKECVDPPKGIKKNSFFEAINTRGLEQLTEAFSHIVKQAGNALPAEYAHLGNLVTIDGSLIDAVLSMEWADYRSGSKKAKAHVGFDINRGIPRKIYLSDGKEGERPFVDKSIEKGKTGIMDRGYGLMVQILGGIITYLLLAICCREQHNEPVSIARVRELRNQIANEAAEDLKSQRTRKTNINKRVKSKRRHAKT